MAEIINCPQCMGEGCDPCGGTGEVLCLDLADMHYVADTLDTIDEGQAEHPGLAPRWLILCVHRGDSEEMQSRARVIRDRPGTCMVRGLGAALTVVEPDLPGSTNVVSIGPGPDWSHLRQGGPDAP